MAASELKRLDIQPPGGPYIRPVRLPILLGVLLGMFAWIFVMPMAERPLSEWIFGIPPGKEAWATPGYYCIHRTLLLACSTSGGTIGVLISPMRRRYPILMLIAILAVIAAFACLFPR